MTDSAHEAAGAAIGYLFQTQWPLVELIRRSKEEPDCQLTLELFDDVAWLEDGLPRELIQSKHHVGHTGGLGDMSVDLWKTIAVWMDAHEPGDIQGPVLTLVTTSIAPGNSAAAHLRPDSFDPEAARTRLETAAQESNSQDTVKAREKFLELTLPQRTIFVSRIKVLDGSPHIEDLDAALQKELHLSVPVGQESVFAGLVWDWWFRQAIALLGRSLPTISALDLRTAIDAIRDTFSDGNLPTLVPREAFDAGTYEGYMGRTFVHQMNFVEVPPVILQRAVQDYYRAVTQSAQWIENNLVGLPDVTKYKRDLQDEWEREFAWAVDRLPDGATEDDKRQAGSELLQRCLGWTEILIRPLYRESFYVRGKLHELADEKLIGWHPEFASLLEDLLMDAPG